VKKWLRRLKRRYRYARWYLNYRVRHNFSAEERGGFRQLASEVDVFQIRDLIAVGNEGIIYDGTYLANPDEPHILKVSRNSRNRHDTFREVLSAVESAEFPFLCKIPEYGLGSDSRYWYQVQGKVHGTMISRLLQRPFAQRLEICDPLVVCMDILSQTRALRELRILDPNVDAENVFVQTDRSVVRIDLDPYLCVPEGSPLPLYPFRRIFRLVLQLLEDLEPIWRNQICEGILVCDLETLDALFKRLRSSAIYGYDSPRKSRHKQDHLVSKEDCFHDLETPIEILQTLHHGLQMKA